MSKPSGKRPNKSRRVLSFGGCQTCRARHRKCDLVEPTCLACQASGLRCERSSTELKWISGSRTSQPSPKSKDSKSARTRQPLYTEHVRESMSIALQADFTEQSIDDCLLRIEATAKDVNSISDSNLQIGPFGVLDFHRSEAVQTSPANIERQEIVSVESHTDLFTSPDLMDSLNECLNWSDLFGLDFPMLNSEPSPLDNAGAVDLANQSQFHTLSESSRLLRTFSQPDDVRPVLQSNIAPELLLNFSSDEAQTLLRHFQEKTLAHMSSFPLSQKSPFYTVNLARAIQTLAHISYLKSPTMLTTTATHAAFSNLLALLAFAAKSLATTNAKGSDTAAQWQQVSDGLLGQAKTNLQWSLQAELQGSSKAKYKDQLMAIKALQSYAVAYDNQTDARDYMIDAERLLRIRGLAKRRISRKCQLMHHYYTYMRIIGETTYVLQDYKNFESGVASVSDVINPRQLYTSETSVPAWVPPGHNPRLDDFLGFERSSKELVQSTESHSHVNVDGNPELDPRDWSESSYLQLYGLSQTWLSFVSQTTRLANLLDRIASDKSGHGNKDAKYVESLEKRKDKLENAICSFIASTSTSIDTSIDKSSLTPHRNMVRTLNPALIIFFNRRIRGVNSWVLQEHINVVIQILRDCNDSLLVHNLEGPGAPWPVFIAGCEAMSKAQRDFFWDWMQCALEQTGFTRFQSMSDVMQEVWRRRDEDMGGDGWTWMNVCREKSLYIMCT